MSWAHLGSMLAQCKVRGEQDFLVERIDPQAKMGADFIARTGLGDELNYIAVDKHSPLLLSQEYPNIFSVGDACDIPASKARFGPVSLGRTVTEPKHRVPKKVDTAS